MRMWRKQSRGRRLELSSFWQNCNLVQVERMTELRCICTKNRQTVEKSDKDFHLTSRRFTGQLVGSLYLREAIVCVCVWPLRGTTQAFGHVYILVFGLGECVHIGHSSELCKHLTRDMTHTGRFCVLVCVSAARTLNIHICLCRSVVSGNLQKIRTV